MNKKDYFFYFVEDSLQGDDPNIPFFTAKSANEFMQKMNLCIIRQYEDEEISARNRARFCYEYDGYPGAYAKVKIVDKEGNEDTFLLKDNPSPLCPDGVGVPSHIYQWMQIIDSRERDVR